MYKSEGGEVGKINGLAIIGDRSGIVLPIAAEAAPAHDEGLGGLPPPHRPC